MKKPCKHPKKERHVTVKKRHWSCGANGNGGGGADYTEDVDYILVICALCGKKLREVEVHD